MRHETWDAIIVGSGIGGLTTAALLAKFAHKKVLVLERHSKVGGCTHSFSRRKNYIFDVGVHFLGGLAETTPLYQLLNRLTDGRLKLKPLAHELDRVFLPEVEYHVPADFNDLKTLLEEKFPAEKKSIGRYFKMVRRYGRGFYVWQFAETVPLWLRVPLRLYLRLFFKTMFRTTDQVLNELFKDPRIKTVLTCQWQSMGVSPRKGAFGLHCTTAECFYEGSWYPEGGGERLPAELARAVLDHGGVISVDSPVERILVKDGKACGVRLAPTGTSQAREIFAEVVVSSIGARGTYLDLLRDQPVPFLEEIKKTDVKDSYIAIYLGIDRSPREFGIDSANHWLFADYEFNPIVKDDRLNFIDGIYLSSPSIKRGSAAHTLEIMSMAPTDFFEKKWGDSAWHKRPEEYKAFKKQIYDHVMNIVETRFPGLREAVLFYEVSTPLTVQHFITGPLGSLGLPSTPARFRLKWASSTTPIKNLYISGVDSFCWSVNGAMIGGIKAYRLIVEGISWKNIRKGFKVDFPEASL